MRFVEHFFDGANPMWLKRAVVGFLVCLSAFHIWNAWHFNPLWGYDGGGHLDYITSLDKGHFPSIATNDIAWHEPLYYFFMAIIGWLHAGSHTFGLVQAGISIAVAIISWLVIQKLTKSPWARAMAFVTWNLLPAVTMASAFVTNELLNYFFILLILFVAHDEKVEANNESAEGRSQPSPLSALRSVWLLAFVCALALLTKVTAIVAIAAVIFLIVMRKQWKSALIIVGIVSLLYAPWLAFRTENILPTLSINNTAFMSPAPLALDARVKFFLMFDADIFTFPYWYAGGRGFWSMIYADTFYDYYGMMKNPDVLAQLPADQKVATDRNGGFTTSYKLKATSSLPFLALPLALITLLGAYELIRRPLELPSLVALGLFASLVYFSYRYPYYERGIVKSIFIAPAFLPMLTAGFTSAEKRLKQAWGKPVISALIFVYVATLLSTVTMAAQGY